MIELIQACAPSTPVPIAQAIIQTESAFNPFAIGVNKGKQVTQPKSYNEAVITAKKLLTNGSNIDLGLAQINSANLKWLGLTVEQVLQPCNNLKAMQFILSNCYQSSGGTGYGTKMQRAFSCYNTGNHRKGFYNNYVNKVTNNYSRFAGATGGTYLASNNSYGNQTYKQALPKKGTDLAIYANNVNGSDNQFIYEKGVDFNPDLSKNDVVVKRASFTSDNQKDNSISDAFASPQKDAFSF